MGSKLHREGTTKGLRVMSSVDPCMGFEVLNIFFKLLYLSFIILM